MPRLSSYQEFVLTFTSPWNLGSKTNEDWTQSFYVTGSITHTDTDAEAAGLALAGPALAFASSKTSLTKLAYYPSGSQVSTVNKVYTPGTHPGTASVYAGGSTGYSQQLEVAAVAHCPIGKNTRGKEVYLRKYLHDVVAGADQNSLPGLAGISGILAPWNSGAGPHLVRPCSPTTGVAGATWTVETHLFTHQLRKGKKRKKPGAAGLLDDLIKTVGGAAAVEILKKVITSGAAAG